VGISILKDLSLDPHPGRGQRPYQWLAIQNGIVASLGHGDHWKNLPYENTMSAAGAHATWGFTDAHCHVCGLGLRHLEVNLKGAKSLSEIIERLARAPSREVIDGRAVIRGAGWDQHEFHANTMPTRHELDGAFPNALLLLRRTDGHALWTNTATLEFLGISGQSQDPVGGRFERDGSGDPTGVLVDKAMDDALACFPERSREILREAYRVGFKLFREAGFTAVHEAGVPQAWFRALSDLEKAGELGTRVWTMGQDREAWEDLLGGNILRMTGPRQRVARHFVKFYLDGAFGSRGAFLMEPYCDCEEAGAGVRFYDKHEIGAWIERFHAMGIGTAFHAIGDAALQQLIETLEEVSYQREFVRVEHAQMATDDQVRWLGKNKITCAVQPIHAVSDAPWIESRVGRERLSRVHRLKSYVDAGVPVILSSDAPIEEFSLPHALMSATLRRSVGQYSSCGIFRAEEALQPSDALARYQTEPAHSMGVASVLGEAAVGRFADLSFFQDDFWNRDPASWSDIKCVGTMVGGELEIF
jgi:predicted amidohydrolase YtcJ